MPYMGVVISEDEATMPKTKISLLGQGLKIVHS